MTDPQWGPTSASGPAEGALPARFGKYVLLHQLASGGMGTVFIGRSGGLSNIQKLHVIKTLRSHLAGDSDYIHRFMDEARVVVQLDHKNIARVSDVGRTDGRYYLTMELIRGVDLRTLFRAYEALGEVMPTPLVIHVLVEMLEALDYAHRLKDPATGHDLHLVHRDISPQNVMVSFEGEVKVIDFGLAASTLKLEETAPQLVMGKISYMSPEQARGEKVDRLTDVFATCVVAYELFTGARYYEGMSPHQIWAVAGSGEYRPPHWDRLDPQLQEILARGLNPSSSVRPQSCAELRSQLVELALDRRYRAGAPELRKAMHELFADDIEQQRRLIAACVSMSLEESEMSAPSPALFDDSSSLPPTEHTLTATAQGAASDTGETRTEKVAVLRAAGPLALASGRRWPLAAAASALVAAVVVGAFAFGGSDAERSPPPAEPAPVVGTTGPEEGGEETPSSTGGPLAPAADPGPSSSSSATPQEPPAAAAPAEERAPAPTSTASRPEPAPKRAAKPGRRGRRAPPKPPPAVEKPAPPPAPAANAPPAVWVAHVARHCAHTTCGRSVKKAGARVAQMSLDEVTSLAAQAKACWKRCQ